MVPNQDTDSVKPRTIVTWTWLIVIMGLCLRAFHYFRAPIMWHDEAALVMNVLWLDFSQLLGPLVWHEAAPPLFLFIERGIALAFDDNLMMLRLLPFTASCASLLLMIPICRRCLRPSTIPWALLCMACSDSLLFHACEAKPYALDVFTATLLLAIYTSRWTLPKKLIAFSVLAPVLLSLSYPACFLYGGCLLALLPEVWHATHRSVWAGFIALGVIVCGCFLLVALGPAQAQRDTVLVTHWGNAFPDWDHIATVPKWLIVSTCEAFRYCFKPMGSFFPIFALVGAGALWYRRQKALLVVMAMPLVLAIIAACLHAYPYGSSRVVIYAAPGLAILIATGVEPLTAWLRRTARPVSLVGLILIATVSIGAARRTVFPWDRCNSLEAAQWVCDQRDDSEGVLGNDWTYHYYLRDLGPKFLGLVGNQPLPTGNQPQWLLFNGLISKQERLHHIETLCSAGWEIGELKQFDTVTVVKLIPSVRMSQKKTALKVAPSHPNE